MKALLRSAPPSLHIFLLGLTLLFGGSGWLLLVTVADKTRGDLLAPSHFREGIEELLFAACLYAFALMVALFLEKKEKT